MVHASNTWTVEQPTNTNVTSRIYLHLDKVVALNYLVDVVHVEVGYVQRVTHVFQPPLAANDTESMHSWIQQVLHPFNHRLADNSGEESTLANNIETMAIVVLRRLLATHRVSTKSLENRQIVCGIYVFASYFQANRFSIFIYSFVFSYFAFPQRIM